MKLGTNRTVGIVIFTLLYPLMGLFVVNHIPNPMVPNAIVALNMILPVLAGYFYGSLSGAVVGGLGTALAALIGISIYDGLSIFPHIVMGLVAGHAGKRHSELLASVSILVGHSLNMLFFLRLGILSIKPEAWGLTLLGLATESMIDIVAVVLVIALCKNCLYQGDRW